MLRAREICILLSFAELDFVMSPDEKISGFSVHTIPDS